MNNNLCINLTAYVFQAHQSLKSKPKLLKQLNKAIDKTLTAPQIQNMDEVKRQNKSVIYSLSLSEIKKELVCGSSFNNTSPCSNVLDVDGYRKVIWLIFY